MGGGSCNRETDPNFASIHMHERCKSPLCELISDKNIILNIRIGS